MMLVYDLAGATYIYIRVTLHMDDNSPIHFYSFLIRETGAFKNQERKL